MTLACQHLPSHLLACCLIFDDQPELNDISSLLSGDKKVHPMLRLYLQQRHICQAVTVLLRIMELAHMRVCPTSPDIPKILYFIQEGEWMNTIRDVVMYILMITSHENQGSLSSITTLQFYLIKVSLQFRQCLNSETGCFSFYAMIFIISHMIFRR